MKGDVRFDSQLVFLSWLKYTVVCSIKVLQQLAVQKPESTGERNTCKVLQTLSDKRSIFRTSHEMLEKQSHLYRTNPLLEMISAWQSLTVSPLRLSSSPLTQRFPDAQKYNRHCQRTQQHNISSSFQTSLDHKCAFMTISFFFKTAFTSSKANHGAQALPSPHDDGG